VLVDVQLVGGGGRWGRRQNARDTDDLEGEVGREPTDGELLEGTRPVPGGSDGRVGEQVDGGARERQVGVGRRRHAGWAPRGIDGDVVEDSVDHPRAPGQSESRTVA
jgi:hypothetical protein